MALTLFRPAVPMLISATPEGGDAQAAECNEGEVARSRVTPFDTPCDIVRKPCAADSRNPVRGSGKV
jgi:hypothetical protein